MARVLFQTYFMLIKLLGMVENRKTSVKPIKAMSNTCESFPDCPKDALCYLSWEAGPLLGLNLGHFNEALCCRLPT